MIFCYSLNELVFNLLFIAFIKKIHVSKKNWKKEQKMTKMKQIQSLGTKMQILKSYFAPHDEDLRVLRVNWMRKEVKRMNYSKNIIIYQLSTEKVMLWIFSFILRSNFGIENVRIGKFIHLEEL